MKKVSIIAYTVAVLFIGVALGHLIKESDARQYCGRCNGHGVVCDLEIIDEKTLEVRIYQPHRITRVYQASSSDARIIIAK